MEYKYLCRQITNQCIIAMAKVGYIFNSEQYDTFTFDRAWMEKYGCCRIIEDNASQEKTRPEWKQLMDCLERGDELVIEHSTIPNCGNRRNNSTFKIQNSTFIRTADPRRSGTRSRG